MSYILEALRKSERERQIGQAPSLPILVADAAQPQRQRWLPWIVSILLLTMNVAALLYFGFGDNSVNRPEKQAIAAAPPAKPVMQAEPTAAMPSSDHLAAVPEAPRNDAGEQQERAAVKSANVPSVPMSDRTPPDRGIADAAPSASRSVPEKNAAVTPSAVDRKPMPSAAQKALNEEKRLVKEKAEKPVERRESTEIRRAAENSAVPAFHRSADNAVKTEVNREALPLLSAMPEDIRSRMPSLTVNMLAYSSVPKERFAVVNMVKYTNGDPLPGGAVLLEIRPDGLVLDLDGTRFRIPQR